MSFFLSHMICITLRIDKQDQDGVYYVSVSSHLHIPRYNFAAFVGISLALTSNTKHFSAVC
jgi:hypothetical protein